MPDFSLHDQTLFWKDIPIITHIGDMVTLIEDPSGVGAYLRFSFPTPEARWIFPLGSLENVSRFTACRRWEPFWMVPIAGEDPSSLPTEVQSLILELKNGLCALLIPLIDDQFRTCIQGSGGQALELHIDSGDPQVKTQSMIGLYVAVGADVYPLVEGSAESVCAWLKTTRLRGKKPLPKFLDQFGWCTWNAFYQEVSEQDVRRGLESFKAGGVQPKFLILDDGWQSKHEVAENDHRLTAFQANDKFPGDLAPIVKIAKEEYGIQSFLVWHAMNGYWSGVDGDAMPQYQVRSTPRQYSPEIIDNASHVADTWGSSAGLVPPETIQRFFQDYHQYLRQQGVDGVKVDNQSALEGLGAGSGGRVELMRRYHEALEASAQDNFHGNLINCMSCSNDMLYNALNSSITRTSTDFLPDLPFSHGLHLYTNAQVAVWFGEFIYPDWDMFQSAHPTGAFHAAARAVSGSPIYVSDSPESHDFDLLRKLVLPDGSLLRPRGTGRPTRDCLFHDPCNENILLKVFNHNPSSGVIGVFNCHFMDGAPEISGAVRPCDVIGLEGERFAVYAHNRQELRLLQQDEAWEIALPSLGFEVFTIAPIHSRVAFIGLADLFNSAGAVQSIETSSPSTHQLRVQGGGRFLVWCEQEPQKVELDESSLPFQYHAAHHTLEMHIPPGVHQLTLQY